ncbi:RNA polymerase factor sigma-54 [Devosia sp. 63-57]|uniref:RNA polymerase factor sigma-54 n=1 Tax=Devosia sp. 63-57 TaxID=1895751 RepID=UPI00086A6FC8|nr:RNA polymerase factor sigma-54 [Devosia sp. 63-57]ODT48195.1 MAG: RNA polymerase sigma-54 factor [Pelagibacterium sp. SCN 63-126]ODU85354.1 MAG: RNA polymerase sigma-54 factor [Pelagibacterium sp. SCN 63-17]OJX42096.1 MAG: RNA polymerase sigma-54 factor [Devosia sp. 63-57]
MALSPRLEFRQSQSLTLTPQLMQSIRLLQLSHLELNDFVDAELLRNPLLEREEGGGADDAEPTEPAERATELSAYEDTVAQGDRIKSADQIAEGYDTAVENVFPDQAPQELSQGSSPDRNGSFEGGEAPDIDQFVASRPRLSDHLEAQAHMLLRNPADRLIALHLIDGLNEAGYLTVELQAVADLLGAEVEDVEAVLGVLQSCDPLGMFARSVPECLAIQLRERDRLDPMMQRLLDNLTLLADHNMPALLKAVGCDREDLADMLGEIRQLDPKPGLAFDSAPIEAIVPDVFVRSGPDGGWQVELNSDILPRVLVNRVYYATVTKKTRDSAEKTFLSDCLATANWLTKSLDQRAQTITKVAAEIVRQQDGFLTHGVAHLKPMTLKMVAEAIEMHESTVSRVTAQKYIATPRGLYEMKYFFTTAIASSDGGSEHSAEAVRHRIRQLIDAEAATDILSDDTIAEILRKEQGIDVARRTVAKYREGMNIPSSVIRRRQKKELDRSA